MMRIAMMMIRVVSKVYFSSGHLQRGEVRHKEDKQLVEMKLVYKCRNVVGAEMKIYNFFFLVLFGLTWCC